ncbi:MAG: hypothetical protein GY810_27595 [Aureispira sp.]|nr:hypothetical protein [Aureispira sp.]
MCDLTKGFKLCSCDGEQLKQEDIGWVLQRLDPDQPIQNIMGKVAIQRFNIEEETLRNNVEEYLNAQNCFDFDFQPQDDDRIKIKYKTDTWFAYRHQNGQWKIDDSTSLSSWRSQLELHKNGKLK